jgi:hypothetical protein
MERPRARLVAGTRAARRELSDTFRPSISAYPTRFAWFGTELVLDAFTFSF